MAALCTSEIFFSLSPLFLFPACSCNPSVGVAVAPPPLSLPGVRCPGVTARRPGGCNANGRKKTSLCWSRWSEELDAQDEGHYRGRCDSPTHTHTHTHTHIAPPPPLRVIPRHCSSCLVGHERLFVVVSQGRAADSLRPVGSRHSGVPLIGPCAHHHLSLSLCVPPADRSSWITCSPTGLRSRM